MLWCFGLCSGIQLSICVKTNKLNIMECLFKCLAISIVERNLLSSIEIFIKFSQTVNHECFVKWTLINGSNYIPCKHGRKHTSVWQNWSKFTCNLLKRWTKTRFWSSEALMVHLRYCFPSYLKGNKESIVPSREIFCFGITSCIQLHANYADAVNLYF